MRNKEYFDNPAVSQSDLCLLDASPKLYKEKLDGLRKDILNAGQIFGSAVDCLITDTEAFGEEFYVLVDNSPSDSIVSIMWSVYKHFKEIKEDPPIETTGRFANAIIDAAEGINYGKNYKRETIISKVLDSGTQYYLSLKEAEGKTTIRFDDYERVLSVVETLKTGKFTKNYILPVIPDVLPDDREVLYQTPIYWKYKDIDCKSLLDIIIVNHKDKTVKPVDIKTTSGSVYGFPDAFIKWRYYIQAAFYVEALKTYIKKDFNKYKTLSFGFVVADQNNYNSPLIYELILPDIALGTIGGSLSSGRKVKGWIQLLDDLQWHKKNNLWEYKREDYENKGVIKLDIV